MPQPIPGRSLTQITAPFDGSRRYSRPFDAANRSPSTIITSTKSLPLSSVSQSVSPLFRAIAITVPRVPTKMALVREAMDTLRQTDTSRVYRTCNVLDRGALLDDASASQPCRQQRRPRRERRAVVGEPHAVRPLLEHVQFGRHARLPQRMGGGSGRQRRQRAVFAGLVDE